MLKKLLICILTVGLLAMAAGCGSSKEEKVPQSSTITGETAGTEAPAKESSGAESTASKSEEQTAVYQGEQLTGKHHAEITVKDYGTIAVELDADNAPISVTNFVKLAEEGFYDGLTFHRIISGFMIQGGDPNGNGTGGSKETIKGEFSANGVDNPLKHTRGAISMARSSKPDSASSQFFIMHQDASHLDGQYACFGYVTDGMDVVDAICDAVQVEDRNGTVLPKNQPVIESIRVLD
ncbi:MAG: peptidylprolyl isomerase [Acetatifactor sp.]|nr:peptidylprolyl isomerase [Acetatifactor sp.]